MQTITSVTSVTNEAGRPQNLPCWKELRICKGSWKTPHQLVMVDGFSFADIAAFQTCVKEILPSQDSRLKKKGSEPSR